MLKARRRERPASCVCEPLSLRQVELASLAFLDIDVDSDPAEDRSVVLFKRLRAAEEPAITASSVSGPKTHFARAAGSQALRPDPPRLFVIFWMEKRDMRVPCGRGVRSRTKRMIAREPSVVRISLVDEDEAARRRPCTNVYAGIMFSVACNWALSGSSMHSTNNVQNFTIGELSPTHALGNPFRSCILRWTTNCSTSQ